jgi:D-beta-D-heptose 7-phosphate kinase/D-beta-D-heptose 1-phosphate adenosyltransferase
MDALLQRLSDWQPFRAVVVGDLMLDRLTSGEANRLSADAPVPVLRVTEDIATPGGAANVARDLAAMGGRVIPVGVVGDDTDARVLLDQLSHEEGIELSGIVSDASRPTTVKQNLIGLAQGRHPQKMFRLDRESTEPISPEIAAQLLERVRTQLADADVVCIEDYDKGVCSKPLCRALIDMCNHAGVPVLVDPAKIRDFTRYAGATAITPNRTEAEHATGLTTAADGSADSGAEHNAQLARQLQAIGFEAVVLTLDRHGALLLLEDDPVPAAVPTVARSVYDVTGAGDMMLAGLAAGRANGLSWVDAVRFANTAAGLEVEVFGVEPIPIDRIVAALIHEQSKAEGKTRTLKQAALLAEAERRSGRKIVFTNGCFDVLHAGHVHLLESARSLGDMLIVGMNSDASISHLKGPNRPVHGEKDRARVLGALECVDAVVIFADETPISLIEHIGPDVLVKGADYESKHVVGRECVEAKGGRVELVGLLDGRSTTAALERLELDA